MFASRVCQALASDRFRRRRYFGYVYFFYLWIYLFWADINGQIQTYPDLQPLYEAARSYLEVPQRIELLNTRVEVC